MAIDKKITAALVNDNTVNPVLGLVSGVIINYEDIDWTATTFTGSIITALVLKSGTAGFEISWLKRMGSNNSSFNASQTEREGHTHSFACQLAGFSAANADLFKEMSDGKFIIVAESNFRGVDSADVYKVFGITTGLYLSEGTSVSNENSGAMPYILQTSEGDLEEYMFNTYYETNHATSKAAYESLFATV